MPKNTTGSKKMSYTHLSNFLSTLFNIPHERYPMPADVEAMVRGETIKDIKVEVLGIVQEMSVSKVQRWEAASEAV